MKRDARVHPASLRSDNALHPLGERKMVSIWLRYINFAQERIQRQWPPHKDPRDPLGTIEAGEKSEIFKLLAE